MVPAELRSLVEGVYRGSGARVGESRGIDGRRAVAVENSEAPVHIDLYTGSKLERLFGSHISVRKYECHPFKFLAPWFGWFQW